MQNQNKDASPAKVQRSPKAAPIVKKEEHGCLFWEVVLEKREDNNRYGFSHSHGREKFQKERHRKPDEDCSADDALEGPETLLVKRVTDAGLLDEWNKAHLDGEVRVGDHLIEVNGSRTIPDMQSELRADKVKILVSRYPHTFNVDLEKRPGASKLGFKFEKPKDRELQTLKITEVNEEGLLEEMNKQNLATGRCHLVVVPGMHIEAANGIDENGYKIAEELRTCKAVKIRFRRSDPVEKMKVKMLKNLCKLGKNNNDNTNNNSNSRSATPSRQANLLTTPSSAAASHSTASPSPAPTPSSA